MCDDHSQCNKAPLGPSYCPVMCNITYTLFQPHFCTDVKMPFPCLTRTTHTEMLLCDVTNFNHTSVLMSKCLFHVSQGQRIQKCFYVTSLEVWVKLGTHL